MVPIIQFFNNEDVKPSRYTTNNYPPTPSPYLHSLYRFTIYSASLSFQSPKQCTACNLPVKQKPLYNFTPLSCLLPTLYNHFP